MADLLLGDLLSNGRLVDWFAARRQVLLDALDAVALDVAGRDEHRLERAQTEVVVRL